MFRCLPTGARLYESREICENWVAFVNVKATYRIDEDVVVDYTLRNEFKPSTRDWIGIFPRNWLNLQQYLTFEYTLSPAANAKNPLSRTITFPRIFHREAPLNLEYRFVYISKEIQVMAVSTCFRFAHAHCKDPLLEGPCTSSNFPTMETFSSTTVNNNEPSVNEDKSAVSEIPSQITVPQGLPLNCRYCHRQICGSKVDQLRGDFLTAFSDSLLSRVHRLERDLSLAENSLKNAKGARENLAKRLRAYEAFVAEMLGSLAVRGIVKITDEKGKEIVLQRVRENDRSPDEHSKKVYKLEDEIVALKSLLAKQQQTIVELTEQRKFYIAQRERTKLVDREVQTNPDSAAETAWDLTVTHEMKNNDRIGKTSSEANVEGGKKLVEKYYDSKAQNTKTDAIEQSENLPMDQTANITNAVPRVLKIPKPSGILVQGKNVKFAIVRL